MYKKLVIIFLLSIFSVTGCQKSAPEDQLQDNNLGGDKVPAFTLKNTEGKNVSLSDFKGKVIVVDFWATWCGPCRRGIPDLISLQKEFKDELVVIGISLDRETVKDVVPFVKKNEINYPIVYGNEEVVNQFGGIQAIPTSFVIDKNGNIVDKHVGLVDKSVYSEKIKELIKKS